MEQLQVYLGVACAGLVEDKLLIYTFWSAMIIVNSEDDWAVHGAGDRSTAPRSGRGRSTARCSIHGGCQAETRGVARHPTTSFSKKVTLAFSI